VKPENSRLAASGDALGEPEARVSKQAAGSGIDEKRNISLLNRTVIVGRGLKFGKLPGKSGGLAALHYVK